MKRSGSAHKALSVLLRLGELAFAVIVLGILSRFCYLISIAQVNADGRIIYTMVVAGIAIIYSIFFCPPFDALFLGFPFDFILFIMWLVAFCLLETRTGTRTCSSSWYHNYWGYYWGRFWRVGPAGTVAINGAGCSQWQTVLAFSFIASITHVISGLLGIYVYSTYIELEETAHDVKRHAEKLTGRHPRSNGYEQSREVETSAVNTQPAETQPV